MKKKMIDSLLNSVFFTFHVNLTAIMWKHKKDSCRCVRFALGKIAQYSAEVTYGNGNEV